MTDPTPAAPAPAATADTGNPVAQAAATTANWYDGFGDDAKGYVQNKGWKGPDAVVESYRNLEKLIGVPAEHIVKLPRSDAPPEAWNEVWSKLGRPAAPKDYGFSVPEGADGTFQEWAGKTFHELGMPTNMARNLAEKWDAFTQQMADKDAAEQKAANAEQEKTLRATWGAAFDQNVGVARQAAAKFGVDGATIDQLESVMGTAKTMEFFHAIGSRMGEGNFVTGNNTPGFGVMTPEAAKARINTLRNDSDFANRYLNGDVAARDEMRRLHQWAYPE